MKAVSTSLAGSTRVLTSSISPTISSMFRSSEERNEGHHGVFLLKVYAAVESIPSTVQCHHGFYSCSFLACSMSAAKRLDPSSDNAVSETFNSAAIVFSIELSKNAHLSKIISEPDNIYLRFDWLGYDVKRRNPDAPAFCTPHQINKERCPMRESWEGKISTTLRRLKSLYQRQEFYR